ncbi:MAG: sensor histidine kinase [Thermodesulfobacteriota bacterium]
MGEVNWRRLGGDGLEFFGRMTAGVTHELKNHLSTIKEQTGLISDLLALAARGRPLNGERLERLAEGIIRRVAQTDEVIRRLNYFAHGTDAGRQTADLGEIVWNIVTLSRRLASMKGVELEAAPVAAPVSVEGHPFFLGQMVFLCLERALVAAGSGGRVEVSVVEGEAWVECLFTGRLAGPITPESLEATVGPALKAWLGASLIGEPSGGLRLRLPRISPDL